MRTSLRLQSTLLISVSNLKLRHQAKVVTTELSSSVKNVKCIEYPIRKKGAQPNHNHDRFPLDCTVEL
jgi:hypothetical protein